MIDANMLRSLLATCTTRPWRSGNRPLTWDMIVAEEDTWIGDAVDNDDRNLIIEAVNALPELLAVYEAAVEWRDAVDPYGPTSQSDLELREAIDATRAAK